jgi:hypothetical protein
MSLSVLCFNQSNAATIYVKHNASGSNNGTSWTNAYTSLQSAISNASSGDEVWVAAGTYKPSAYPVGRTTSDTREYAFYLESGVEYYGGFAGTETLRSQRDYENNVTILSGDISGSNCYHVLVSANESSVVLDGFTVTAGYANGGVNATINGQSGFWTNNGGGIFTYGTTMTIANCTISNNTAGYGGAMKLTSGNTTISNTSFTSNNGTAHAGAIDLSGTLVVSGCTFTSNTTATGSNGNGGAIKISGGNATISNTSFTSNAGRIGGAIHHYNSQLTISTSTFKNNSATNHSGALYASHTAFTVNKCIFDGNTATNNGGGISTGWGATMTLSNSVFSENTSGSNGGAIANDMQNGSAINCTFYNNTASGTGGGYYSGQTSNHINGKNCVFWGNKKGSSSTVAGADIYGGSFTYSLTQSNSNFSSGTGIVNNQDPLFVNASDPDGADNTWMTKDDGLKLKSTSPAVDAGLNSAISGHTTDIVGTTRIVNTTVNMGAYELLACQQGNSLPSAAATYTATYADTDGNYTCYCDDNQNLILGLNLTGTGAVVPTTGVSLEVGATTTTTYNSAGGIITNTNGGVIFNRKWNVTPTTQPTSDVTVLYPFTNTEYSAIVTALSSKSTTITNANQLQMYKLTSSGTFADPHANGATGIILAHGSSATSGNWVHSAHTNGTDHLATYKVASFSGGGGGGGASGSPLPVDLIHFDVHAATNHSASLHWATASEINNSHFEIERSYDSRTFEMIDQVVGNGNSQHQIDYNYIDDGIHSFENTAFYRLKQVDFDGTSEYSDIRVVRFDELGSGLDFSAYPNPLTNELSVMVSLSNGEAYQIEVTNLQGAKVHQENHVYDNGIHKLNTSEWNSGMYILQVASESGSKFVKVMKK